VREAPTDLRALYAGGSLGDLVIAALRQYPDRVAFVDGERRVTYADCAAAIGRAIALFGAIGLRRGDTIAQLSGNRPETFFVMAAAYIGGFRSVTLHALGSEDDHAYIIDDCDAACLVFDSGYAARADALRKRCTKVRHWFAHAAHRDDRVLWEDARRLAPAPLACAAGSEDIIRIAYTGGTTGRPKGVMLSNRAMVTNILLSVAGNPWPETPRVLCCTPISHGAGSLMYPTLMKGGTFFLQQTFDPDRFLDAVETHRCNVTFLVPTIIYKLLDHPRTRTVDWSHMYGLMYGAAPMSPARIREALQVFGPVLAQGYGQTEAPNTILTLTREDHVRGNGNCLNSAGRPYPGLRVALLDDACNEVEPGAIGEICVRGPLVMSGYWKQPELTAEALRGDWLHTGDLAWQDAEGYYYIVDRKKDMIISGGFNVFPKEIEDILTAHPAIAIAAVIGVPDPVWGEAVKAVVVPRAGAALDVDELVALVKHKKGAIYAPKTVDVVDSIPVTVLGKPDKKALRASYWGDAQRKVN
jgi:fatty-acyl-CoA synthase